MYDLIGQRFSRLLVLKRDLNIGGKGKQIKWICQCDCGNITSSGSYELRKGTTKSCGCFSRYRDHTQDNIRHGMHKTRTYHSWEQMKQRCQNPKATRYPSYGAVGITVCERWQLFDNFFADMGDRPEGKTLDRINPFGNYEPGNCRWATYKEQANNQRRHRKSEGG